MSKRLKRFIKNLPPSKTDEKGDNHRLVDDLFGIRNGNHGGGGDSNGIHLDSNGNEPLIKTVKPGIGDIPDKVLLGVCEYLKEHHLKSVRLVSKRFNDIATDVFVTIHTPIRIDSEDSVFKFNGDLDKSFKFPFSRFKLILEPIKRHLLVTFVRAYNSHMLTVNLEPTVDKRLAPTQIPNEVVMPKQRLLFKLTGILEELTAVEHLDITYPTMGMFDYFELDFKLNFDLSNLKTLSIWFATSGFCQFSADLTLEILRTTVELKTLRMRLPEPCNGVLESDQLRRVLKDEAAQTVPSIKLTLYIDSDSNLLVRTLINIVANDENSRITALVFRFSAYVASYRDCLKLIRACRRFLLSLSLFRRKKSDGTPSHHLATVRLPALEALRHLEIESHHIPIQALDKDQFPSLSSCVLHLRYGNEQFYLRSILHPLNRLKLHFHDSSIVHHLVPETRLPSLFSCYLTKLHLVNPPPEHLTFMGEWAQNLETLIVSAPCAYDGADPSYQLDKVLAQLRGDIQLRDYYPTELLRLQNLVKLHLLLPIDESMAVYLAQIPKLWQLYVDDSKLSQKAIYAMKYHHVTYVSWEPSPKD